jgi:hypothetical protein
MDPIKEAFSKIKEDISILRQEILNIHSRLADIQSRQTIPTHNPTQDTQQTDRQTHDYPSDSAYQPNNNISTGNEGVPTDRQTHQQTDRHTEISSHNPINTPQVNSIDPISEFKRANEILSSLDDIKKDIRLKFKTLTPQEMLVFSTLYALEEQNVTDITYKLLANNLNLSESSIRDYTNKLAKKGVPIEKIRQNNKTIVLKISPDLKNIATLATIQTLRDI